MLQIVGRNESVEVGYYQNTFYTHPRNVAALAVCFNEIIINGAGMKLAHTAPEGIYFVERVRINHRLSTMGDFSTKFLNFNRINNMDKFLKDWIEMGLIKKIMIYKDNNYFDGIYTSPFINYHLTAQHSDNYPEGLVCALLKSCIDLSEFISDIELQESGQDLYHFYSEIIRKGEAFDLDSNNWLKQNFHTDLTSNLIRGLSVE